VRLIATTDVARGKHSQRRDHWLRQANLTQSSTMLRLAEDIGAPDANAWAAKVLAVALQRGLPPVLVARTLALFGPGAASGTAPADKTPNIDALRQLAADFAAEEVQARGKYNFRKHWSISPRGEFVPSQLTGESARLWSGLIADFGAELAPTLFNVFVRRGGALAVLDALDAAGSDKPLTPNHLAALHFVALSDGSTRSYGGTLVEPYPEHDITHAFTGSGTIRTAETENNFAIRASTEPRLGDKLRTPIDGWHDVHQRPTIVRELEESTAISLRKMDYPGLLGLRLIPTELSLREKSFVAFAQSGRLETALDADGFLAHLTPDERGAVTSLIYGPARQSVFEHTVQRTGNSEYAMHYWFFELRNLLVNAARSRRPPDSELRQKAVALFAFDVWATTHGDDDDLRADYLRTLREVQQELQALRESPP
jgi:hypothetical protein